MRQIPTAAQYRACSMVIRIEDLGPIDVTSFSAGANGRHERARSRPPAASRNLELSLAACLMALRFETNQATFQCMRATVDTIRAENRAARDVAAKERDSALRTMARSEQLRDARAAHPA